jgi:dipeptidyl-peptidase-4
MDQRMVSDYPIIRWGTTPAKAETIKYPMAGGVSHEVTLHVYFPSSKRDVTLQTGMPKDQYLTGVSWSPDEQFIFIGILNRDQNHLWLNQYRADNGAFVKTLFEETSTKYVHPTHGLTFVQGSKDKFIWWSEKDGYEHLYLYGTDGKLIKKLTEGKWVVNELIGEDKKAGTLIITASKESPLCKNIYTLSLSSAGISRLDKGEGMHMANCSEDGKYVLDVYSGKGIPKKTVLRNTENNIAKTLITSADPLADYDRPLIKDITLKASDNTPLYGKLILPTNFDSTRKYPVIVYLYNGPNVQLIHNSFPESGNLWYEYMAQHGYIVFSMDGRGSWNRGLDFEQASFRKLGTVEMEDQLKGVEYLKSLPYVDANRMGVHGWSFGGFMTTSLMLRYPDVFKCAVAGGPVMDWKMYEIMYTERYMDDPKTNAEGYEEANLLSKVNKLKGKLLLIHGTDDNTVVWQHSINFIKKCVDEGVQVDYFVYPGYEHNVRGKDRVHLMQKITDYFDEYLKR